jgi:hypothetical protein
VIDHWTSLEIVDFQVFSKNSLSRFLRHMHSGTVFQKIPNIVHICLFPIQGKGKIARRIRLRTEKFEKSLFQAQIGLFEVFTTMTSLTRTQMGTSKNNPVPPAVTRKIY